ncbi:MAG: tRNA lysidine(34) synthetase TilS [Blautia faecis]
MYQKVKAYMKEHGMVVDGDVVLAGVSGGGDSMAMLEMLKRYQAEAAFSLCAVHVHHGIRGEEADRDERVVRETCEKWTIPFLSYHYPVPELAKKWKMGLEETGRKVRQDAFSRAEADYFGKSETADLQGGGRVSAAREGKLRIRIALAHNENDVAETLLHNLCRGTGLKGLAAILPVRDGIIRPILCLNKQEIVNYLIKEQIPYVTDSTNLTDDYTRNKIRHQILPILEEQVNTSAVRHMAETASLVSQAEEYLSRQGERLVKKYGENRERGIFLSEAFWRDEPAIASYGVLQVFEDLAGET